MSRPIKHRLSRIFQPVVATPKDANILKQDITSKSQRLMLELGLIQQAHLGCFHILPLCLRSLTKLINLVDEEMSKIRGQKLIFPTLTNSNLWKNSGRLQDAGCELFQLKDRHQHDYILSPTHEEVASDLIASIGPVSYKQFPLRLYQITNKYRDEMKPKYGLLRGRQFLMKDMYSFDVDIESAKKTYEEVCGSYDEIFRKIGVNFVKVLGATGNMGGSLSHEYQFKAEIGEDRILSCSSCNYLGNVEVTEGNACPQCQLTTHLEIETAIEVGHTFLLGDRYSKPLHSNYLTVQSKPEVLQMGSYGLGLTRILAASIEILSSEKEIRWPDILAPFSAIVLPPKRGSKEELLTKGLAEEIYCDLQLVDGFQDNVLFDDRTYFTIGRRFLEAKRMGYRFIIVVGKKATEETPLFELNDLSNNTQLYLDKNQLLTHLKLKYI